MASQYYTSKPLPPTPRCYANRCVADSCCGKNPTNSFHAITTPACTAAPTPSSFRNTAPAAASYTATATATSPTYSTTTAHRNTAPAYSTAQATYTAAAPTYSYSAAQPAYASRTSHPTLAACRSSTQQYPPITPTYTATCYSTATPSHNITTPSSLPPTLEELMYRTQLEAEQQHGEERREKGKRKCSLTGGVRRVLKK